MTSTGVGTDPTGGAGRVVVFDGRIDLSYGQFYFYGEDYEGEGDLAAGFVGQNNGLCGAAEPDALWLLTGLHTGNVALTMELLSTEPPIDDSWEEIVEATLPVGERTTFSLIEWEGPAVGSLVTLGPGAYRVRYCAREMDAGREFDTGDGPDSYLLQLWPAATLPDRVVKQTSETAAYWHSAWADSAS